MKIYPALALVLALPLTVFACSDDDHSHEEPAGTDGGSHAGHDAGTSTDAATQADATPGTPVTCKQSEFDAPAALPAGGDYTSAGTVEITFPMDGVPVQYTNRCVKVKVGTTVLFKGSFAAHGLVPKGGDSPSPIRRATTDQPNDTLEVKVTAPGNYGYECAYHPELMYGAIQVVP